MDQAVNSTEDFKVKAALKTYDNGLTFVNLTRKAKSTDSKMFLNYQVQETLHVLRQIIQIWKSRGNSLEEIRKILEE